LNAEFFPAPRCSWATGGLHSEVCAHSRGQGCEFANGRQPQTAESGGWVPDSRAFRQRLETGWRVSEGNTTVPESVFMTALEALRLVTQHQAPGSHQLPPESSPVSKAASYHYCNPKPGVTFFKRPVVGTASTNHVFHGPAAALREHPRGEPASSAVPGSSRESLP
jgi:hypothetical protein